MLLTRLFSILVLATSTLGATDADASTTAAERSSWWQSLESDAKAKLTSYFDSTWFEAQDLNTQIDFCYTASSLYDFATSSADAHTDDFYVGFAPILLRASFHSSGTYQIKTGTGGSNGGTVFNEHELADGQNGCIDKAISAIEGLVTPTVSKADSAVLGGVVALDVMQVCCELFV